MRMNISRKNGCNSFIEKIQRLSGQNLQACYQCGKCTAGCTAMADMDIPPNQVIRFAQLGLFEDLLKAKSIWICASCLTCNARCPKGVGIAEVMEALRQVLLRKRKDHLHLNEIPQEDLMQLPPIALVSSMRKFTS